MHLVIATPGGQLLGAIGTADVAAAAAAGRAAAAAAPATLPCTGSFGGECCAVVLPLLLLLLLLLVVGFGVLSRVTAAGLLLTAGCGSSACSTDY